MQLRVHGPLSWSHGGVAMVLDDPTLHLDGHGRATAEFSVQLDGAGLHARSTERFTAHAVDGDPRAWRAEGTLRIAQGTAMRTALALTPHRVTAQWRDPEGGRLMIEMVDLPGLSARLGSTRSTRSTLQAESFSVASLGHLGRRTLAAWGIDPSTVVLDATVHASGLGADDDVGPGQGEIEIEHLRVAGLTIEHPKLARAPVAFDPLEVEGRLWWEGEHDQGAQLWLAHRGARIALDLQRSEGALDLRTELAPLPCQDLLDAFPAAMSEMVEGTRLRGQVGGRAELHVDRRALVAARVQADRRPDAPAPGTLDLSFPFLDRCTVEHDDPRLDLAALSGAYRHRVLDHHGHEQRRVMAPGAPGYVSVHEVPRLVRAFVSLEDRRFWRHDGFDREQMHNAFWHNVVKGRVSRGASTISQQAARNLWLGVDRSWGRKLQEALLTARLEATTDKRRIMELYLNVIELGPGTHGVDEAARLYFGKPAAALSVLQAIHLASLAPAPTRLSRRFVDGRVDAAWLDGLRAQVRRMARAGLITRAQLRQALHDELGLLDRR
ncbi:MAG: biosynthetic peptidoglycan transglycosylase [Myxococcota bacterium]